MNTYKVKSVTLSRKPGKDKEGLWTAFIGLFDENNPNVTKVPKEVLEIKKVEKVRIRDLLNISYYLMGNDIVINDLTEVNFDKKDNILTLTGKQKL